MPTLPERATSILAVLAEFSPAGRRASSHFDWPALVAEASPADASEAQRRQALRFARLRESLASWVRAQGLPDDHLEECALYTTVATPPDMADARALAIGCTIYWIYSIDDFIDNRDTFVMPSGSSCTEHKHAVDSAAVPCPDGQPAPPAAGRASDDLDRQLAAILAACRTHARGPLRRARVRHTCAEPPAERASPAVTVLASSLGAVLADLCTQWSRSPGASARDRFRQRLVAEQMVACVNMMQRERRWNRAAATHPHAPPLPPFRTYLRTGSISIGMGAVTAAVTGFEERPRRLWRAASKMTEAAGRIVRLANDLHTYEADVDEGKVSAVTIRLRDLGFPPVGHDPNTSRGVRQAQVWVSADLDRAITDFSRLHTTLRLGWLSYYLRHIVAFALAVYGDGTRFKGATEAAS